MRSVFSPLPMGASLAHASARWRMRLRDNARLGFAKHACRWLSRTHRREVRNECIFRFACLGSVACDPYADAPPRHGRSAMALADGLSVRPVPTRATLYARSRPEIAREARARCRALARI